MEKENRDVRIRPAKESDAGALLAIYRPYVTDTAITFEYEVPSEEEFRQRIRGTKEKYPYLLVQTRDGEILGYAYASAFKERAAYDWSVETSIYVRKDCRGRGLGRLLYDALEKELIRQNVQNINACIAFAREENAFLDNTSMKFHEALGYRLVGTFHDSGYKFGRWFDMIWMEKMVGEHGDMSEKPFLPYAKLQNPL